MEEKVVVEGRLTRGMGDSFLWLSKCGCCGHVGSWGLFQLPEKWTDHTVRITAELVDAASKEATDA